MSWPLFDLVVRTPRIELRYLDDDLLDALLAFHPHGAFRPGEEPFDGDASWYHSAPEAHWKALRGEWGARAKVSPEWWYLGFAAIVDGAPVGQQSITGVDYLRLRTVNSFSWLALEQQGKGIGTEMRAAVLHLAFAGLGALRAESDSFDDNAASQGVTRSLGYQSNGTMLAPRPSGGALMSRFLLTRDRWQPRDDIEIVGLEPCLPVLGL